MFGFNDDNLGAMVGNWWLLLEKNHKKLIMVDLTKFCNLPYLAETLGGFRTEFVMCFECNDVRSRVVACGW